MGMKRQRDANEIKLTLRWASSLEAYSCRRLAALAPSRLTSADGKWLQVLFNYDVMRAVQNLDRLPFGALSLVDVVSGPFYALWGNPLAPPPPTAPDEEWKQYVLTKLGPIYRQCMAYVAARMTDAAYRMAIADAPDDHREAIIDGVLTLTFHLLRDEQRVVCELVVASAHRSRPSLVALQAVVASRPSFSEADLRSDGGLLSSFANACNDILLGVNSLATLTLRRGHASLPETRVSLDTWGQVAPTTTEEGTSVVANATLNAFAILVWPSAASTFYITPDRELHANTVHPFVLREPLGSRRLRIIQGSFKEDGPHLLEAARRTGPVMVVNFADKPATQTATVQELCKLGWDAVSKLAALFAPDKARAGRLFIQRTIRLVVTLLGETAQLARPDGSDTATLLIMCHAGIERSLLFLNLVTYLLALVTGLHSGVGAEDYWAPCDRRPDSLTTYKQTKNVAILAAFDTMITWVSHMREYA
jgi:hypothetical protein